jgi:putative transposase
LSRFEPEFFAVFSLAGRSEAMKASKFTDAQKAFVINQGEEGPPVAETREPSANPHV